MASCLSELLNESAHNILYIKSNTEWFLFVFQGRKRNCVWWQWEWAKLVQKQQGGDGELYGLERRKTTTTAIVTELITALSQVGQTVLIVCFSLGL